MAESHSGQSQSSNIWTVFTALILAYTAYVSTEGLKLTREGLKVSEGALDISSRSLEVADDTYRWTLNKDAEDNREKQLDELAFHLDQLQLGEGRYERIRAIADLHPGLGLTIVREHDGTAYDPMFRLQLIEHRHETRSRTVTIDGKEVQQSYTVAVPVELPLPPLLDQAFDCIDCNSVSRLGHYRAAKRLLAKGLEAEMTPDWHIRLARAAIDNGDIEFAVEHLNAANGAVESDEEIYSSRVHEEIGKSLLLLGYKQSGTSFLDQSKEYWRSHAANNQLQRLHTIHEWEAQLEASRNDREAAIRHLEDMAEVTERYSLGPKMTSVMIDEAYFICLAILTTASDPNPVLPVPKEHRSYVDGDWIPTGIYVNWADYSTPEFAPAP